MKRSPANSARSGKKKARRRSSESGRGRAGCDRADFLFERFRRSFCCFLHLGQKITKDKTIAVDDFSSSNGNGRLKNGAFENESVELAVFAAGIGAWREIAEEGFVKFAARETAIENFAVDAGGDGAETLLLEVAN